MGAIAWLVGPEQAWRVEGDLLVPKSWGGTEAPPARCASSDALWEVRAGKVPVPWFGPDLERGDPIGPPCGPVHLFHANPHGACWVNQEIHGRNRYGLRSIVVSDGRTAAQFPPLVTPRRRSSGLADAIAVEGGAAVLTHDALYICRASGEQDRIDLPRLPNGSFIAGVAGDEICIEVGFDQAKLKEAYWLLVHLDGRVEEHAEPMEVAGDAIVIRDKSRPRFLLDTPLARSNALRDAGRFVVIGNAAWIQRYDGLTRADPSGARTWSAEAPILPKVEALFAAADGVVVVSSSERDFRVDIRSSLWRQGRPIGLHSRLSRFWSNVEVVYEGLQAVACDARSVWAMSESGTIRIDHATLEAMPVDSGLAGARGMWSTSRRTTILKSDAILVRDHEDEISHAWRRVALPRLARGEKACFPVGPEQWPGVPIATEDEDGEAIVWNKQWFRMRVKAKCHWIAGGAWCRGIPESDREAFVIAHWRRPDEFRTWVLPETLTDPCLFVDRSSPDTLWIFGPGSASFLDAGTGELHQVLRDDRVPARFQLNLTPEKKLLHLIFGAAGGDPCLGPVSLRCPSGDCWIVHPPGLIHVPAREVTPAGRLEAGPEWSVRLEPLDEPGEDW